MDSTSSPPEDVQGSSSSYSHQTQGTKRRQEEGYHIDDVSKRAKSSVRLGNLASKANRAKNPIHRPLHLSRELEAFELEHGITFPQPRKRFASPEYANDTAQYSDMSEYKDPFLIVHQVTCTRHANHEESLYFDVPRLFAGDDKTTALHGKSRISQDIFSETFMEDNGTISFLVMRTYDCGQYHEQLIANDAFQTVALPPKSARALSKFKAQLTLLAEDGPNAETASEKIYLVTKVLQRAMEVIQFQYPQYFEPDQRLATLDAPYLEIYHARDILRNHILTYGSDLDEVQIRHVADLVEYIEQSQSKKYTEADEQFAEGNVSKKHFSKLFAPDDVVVRNTPEGPAGSIISSLPESNDRTLTINRWSWEFDGVFYKETAQWNVEWPSADEIIPIASLEVYPLRFDKSGLKERLHARGEQFWSCRKRRLVECESLTTSFEFRATCNRFMIDLNTYRQMHPEAINAHNDDGNGLENEANPPNDEFLLILPMTVRGYGFHDKKWTTLPVEQVRDVQWSSDTFDRRLVLKPNKKELIKALITVHTSTNKPQKNDIIEGKGKGLILLLHGGPGTGKTLTAESIAEYARRPLYRVTCGDIGTDPESVEKYLESVLYISTIWGCVVLLDEADVFLEERTPTDLQRNALVSVFLRTLEYFEGILILTSNRVGTFDEAFKSRVQLAMHYPPLDVNDRFEVWDMFFRDILEGDEKLKQDELREKRDVLARHDLNGRQIRNVINTARQLARFRKEILAYTHINQALEVAKEFEDYITRARGHNDEEYAKAEGLR